MGARGARTASLLWLLALPGRSRGWMAWDQAPLTFVRGRLRLQPDLCGPGRRGLGSGVRARRAAGEDDVPPAPSSSSSQAHASEYHAPVMCAEVMQWLLRSPDGVYLDCTLGGGGHSEAMLASLAPAGRVVALDQDPDAIAFASRRLGKDLEARRFTPIRANFRDAGSVLLAEGALPEGGFHGEIMRMRLDPVCCGDNM
jgi:hypothetical protein